MAAFFLAAGLSAATAVPAGELLGIPKMGKKNSVLNRKQYEDLHEQKTTFRMLRHTEKTFGLKVNVRMLLILRFYCRFCDTE